MKICKRGHVGAARTKSHNCVECERLRSAARVNPKAAEYSSRWRKANPEKSRMHAKIWRQRFPEKKIAADSARRAGAALRAPVWANEEKISEKYCEALRLQQETGIRMSVDHVIPLFGELVSGLHVPENLQVIPFVENARKSNQYHVA